MRPIISLLIFFFLFSCGNKSSQRKEALDFISGDAEKVYTIENIETYNNALENNALANTLFTIQNSDVLLDYINTNQNIVLSKQKTNDSLSFVLVTKLKDSIFNNDSIVKQDSSSTQKPPLISTINIKDHTFYASIIDSFFLASNNKNTIASLFNNNANRGSTKKPITSSGNNTFSISTISKTKHDTTSNSLNLFGNTTTLDIDISENSINFRGITASIDSTNALTDYLKDIKPKKHELLNVIPKASKNISSFAIGNLHHFLLNYGRIDSTDIAINTELYELISDLGVFTLRNELYALSTIDDNALELLLFENSITIETYRDLDIKSFNKRKLLKNIFFPFTLKLEDDIFSFKINNTLFFSHNIDDAKQVINDYKNEVSFKSSSLYESIKEDISSESSFLHINNSTTLSNILAPSYSNVLSKHIQTIDFTNYNVHVLQLTSDVGFSHINGVIRKYKEKAQRNTVTEEFSVTTDADILNLPQFVKNHVTRQQDIVVQDIENNLYLFSNSGKRRWKKQLQGPILGAIKQIDIYKNGRLQLVFTTPKRLYVIDRNGNNVTPFPKIFSDDITQPLSVFDYDNNKNYRLLVVQGKNTLMYDAKGKPVKGFGFKSANANIASQPKHFRIGSKDYITFKTNNRFYILNRRGQERITVSQRFNFSNNEIYLYKNKFTTTDASGQLIQIDSRGDVIAQNLSLPEGHTIATTSKTLASLTDNKLTIRSKTIELDFGDYTSPQIFYLNDKIYVSVTDLQTQKVYLFDSQASAIANFPIYGNSPIGLGNIDRDKNLELITTEGLRSIIVYKLN